VSYIRTITTPARVRLLAAALAVLTAGLATSLTVTATDLHADVDTIGHRAASQASTTADLYFEVSEMDADVANALLVGRATDLGTTTAQATADYERHRVGVDGDLQTTVEVASQDVTVQHALRTVIDGLGRYEALTADALQLDTAGLGPAGAGTPARPPAASLARYRQATDLMHSQILPAADDLTSSGANTLDATYEAARGEITTARIWVLLLTAAVLALLVWLQLLFARRYRRLLNPSLIVSTLIVVAITAGLDDLSGWTVIPAVTTLAVVALLVVGVRPRLREYA
jgi:hypothetical protein